MIKKDERDEDGRYRCLFCHGELVLYGTEMGYDVSDYFEEGEDAMVYYLACRVCGRDYEVVDPLKEDKRKQFKEYWEEDSNDTGRTAMGEEGLRDENLGSGERV